MYREDILGDLGIAVPATYDEVLAAAETIRQAGVVEYPLGGTYKTGWKHRPGVREHARRDGRLVHR